MAHNEIYVILHQIPKEYSRRKMINLTFFTVYSLEIIPTEVSSKEYKDSQITSKAWNTSSSCKISYNEKIFSPLGHSVAPSEKNFPPLGHSVATSNKIDTKHESSNHEMDVKNKYAYLNSTSMSSTDSDADSIISANLARSYSDSEEHDNSTEYSDNSRSQNTYVGSDMNNLNDDKQDFKHELNKNAHTFDNPLNDSDSMNPIEGSVVHDCTNSSSTRKKHINYSQETPMKPFATFCSIVPPFSQNSNLNAKAKEFVPSSVSFPVSEERMDDHISLEKLITYNLEDMEKDDIIDYAYHLRDEISKKIREFGNYIDELHVLCDLMEHALPMKCQKIITARMCELVKRYREAYNSSTFNTKPFRHTQEANQREHSSSSQESGYQSRRNDNFEKQQSSGRESSNREEEYTGRSDFSKGYSEIRRKSFERGNSNRKDNSESRHLNREGYSGGERRMTSRGGRNPSRRFITGESHGRMEFRRRILKYTD